MNRRFVWQNLDLPTFSSLHLSDQTLLSSPSSCIPSSIPSIIFSLFFPFHPFSSHLSPVSYCLFSIPLSLPPSSHNKLFPSQPFPLVSPSRFNSLLAFFSPLFSYILISSSLLPPFFPSSPPFPPLCGQILFGLILSKQRE